MPKHTILPTTATHDVDLTSGPTFYTTIGRTTWSLNAGLWLGLFLLVNVLHPPGWFMLLANGALLGVNVMAVKQVGHQATPQWVFVVIAFQALVTLQYAAMLLQAVF